MKTILRLLKLGLAYKWWMLLAAFMGFLTVGSSIGLLMTSAYIISKAALHPSVAELQVGIVGVRFFGITRGIFRYLERLISHETTFRLLARFRVWFYQALEPLVPAKLMQHRSADLLNRIISDIKTLETFYVRVISPPVVAVMVSVLMWFLMGIFNPLFSITLLVFHLFAGIAVPTISYLYSKGIGARIVILRSELNVLLLDAIQGMPEMLVYNQHQRHQTRIKQASATLNKLQMKMSMISAMHEALIGLLMNGAVLFMLIISIPMVGNAQLDGVYLAVLSLGIMASFEAILPLPEAMQVLEANARAAQMLFEISDSPAPVAEAEHTQPLPQEFDLRIRDLTFAYHKEEKAALQDINLAVKTGQKIAIVGPSGAGKSTLVNLLLRFWDYNQGEIFIGDKELRTLAQDELRGLLSVVSQNTYLFSGTFRENLLRANPQADQAALEQAVHRAELETFLAGLAEGMDSWIGDQGLQLSGGERQRVAIARAILRDTPVLILDEATTSLDAFNEQKILHTIKSIAKDKTLLHITHRLSGLEDFDNIYVFQEGRIAEQGRHDSLLNKKGLYYKLWIRQNQQILIEAG